MYLFARWAHDKVITRNFKFQLSSIKYLQAINDTSMAEKYKPPTVTSGVNYSS